MLILRSKAAAGPPMVNDTWQPAPGYTLLEGNTVARRNTGGNASILGTLARSIGKWYAELNIITWTEVQYGSLFGCGNEQFKTIWATNYLGQNWWSLGFQSPIGVSVGFRAWIIANNNGTFPAGAAALLDLVGGTFGMALNITSAVAVTVWFTTNGTVWQSGDPNSLTGGLSITTLASPLFLGYTGSNGGDSAQLVTVPPFRFPVPAGFIPWSSNE